MNFKPGMTVSGGKITWPWFSRPKNLLGRTVLVEITLTMDTDGKTKMDVSTLEPDAPLPEIVKSLFAAAGQLGLKAEELAEKIGLEIANNGPAGEFMLVPKKRP